MEKAFLLAQIFLYDAITLIEYEVSFTQRCRSRKPNLLTLFQPGWGGVGCGEGRVFMLMNCLYWRLKIEMPKNVCVENNCMHIRLCLSVELAQHKSRVSYYYTSRGSDSFNFHQNFSIWSGHPFLEYISAFINYG